MTWLRRPQKCTLTAHAILALWLAVPFVILGAKAGTSLYHFNVVYPAPFLAGGIVLSRLGGALAARVAAPRRPLVVACVAAFVAATVLSQIDFHHAFRQAIRAAGARPGPPVRPSHPSSSSRSSITPRWYERW